MPTVRAPGPYPIAGVKMPTWIVRFDADGVCTSPATAVALIGQLRSGGYTNVLFYSHGWNSDFADAIEQYKSFLTSFEKVVADRSLTEFKPIFVGVTWPSAWFPSDTGPQMAAAPDDATARGEEATVAMIASAIAPESRQRLYELTDSTGLDNAEATELAGLLVAAGIGRPPEEIDGTDHPPQEAAELVGLARLLATQASEDEDDLHDHGIVGGGPVALGAAGLGFLNPRNFLRLFSLYQMKDRAGKVGTNGVAGLLRRVMEGPAQQRVHVFGHSFGAKVMLSAICALGELPKGKKVDSLLLLQPAISYLAMAAKVRGREGPGGYRKAVDRVRSPIVSTFSSLDQPLHDIFHLALRRGADLGDLKTAAVPSVYAALGGYGPQQVDSERGHLLDVGQPYPASSKAIVGLDGSDDRIKNHGDVANRFTAWVLHQQIERVGRADG